METADIDRLADRAALLLRCASGAKLDVRRISSAKLALQLAQGRLMLAAEEVRTAAAKAEQLNIRADHSGLGEVAWRLHEDAVRGATAAVRPSGAPNVSLIAPVIQLWPSSENPIRGALDLISSFAA